MSRALSPDLLAMQVAVHVLEATPGVRLVSEWAIGSADAMHRADVRGWRAFLAEWLRVQRERAREWSSYGSPWWPADRVTFCPVCCTHSDSMHRAMACASGDRKGRPCGDVRA